jgi:hypothetical protein
MLRNLNNFQDGISVSYNAAAAAIPNAPKRATLIPERSLVAAPV